MIPEIRDIILADERINRAEIAGSLRMQENVPVWIRGDEYFGDPALLDRYETNFLRTLSALNLRMEFPTPEGRFVQVVVALPEYLTHGVDANGDRRR